MTEVLKPPSKVEVKSVCSKQITVPSVEQRGKTKGPTPRQWDRNPRVRQHTLPAVSPPPITQRHKCTWHHAVSVQHSCRTP